MGNPASTGCSAAGTSPVDDTDVVTNSVPMPGSRPDPGEVDVAGEHDELAGDGRGGRQQPLAGRRIAVPLVLVEDGAVGQAQVGEHGLLAEHGPRRARGANASAVQASCVAPSIVRDGSLASAHAGSVDSVASPHA